jgi:hypothetical protein
MMSRFEARSGKSPSIELTSIAGQGKHLSPDPAQRIPRLPFPDAGMLRPGPNQAAGRQEHLAHQ